MNKYHDSLSSPDAARGALASIPDGARRQYRRNLHCPRKLLTGSSRQTLAMFALVALGAITTPANAVSLRYSVTTPAFNVTFGTPIANCATQACIVTVSGVGDSASVATFPVVCINGAPSCTLKGLGGGGVWNRVLSDVTVTVYDPIGKVTYGPAALPSGFF